MAYGDILTQALELGKKKYPQAPAQHHAAFANSVSYAVNGNCSGYGGPSMREHYCSRIIHEAGTPGSMSFDAAAELCEGACYGKLTAEIAYMLVVEHCFDDAPGECEESEKLNLNW